MNNKYKRMEYSRNIWNFRRIQMVRGTERGGKEVGVEKEGGVVGREWNLRGSDEA